MGCTEAIDQARDERAAYLAADHLQTALYHMGEPLPDERVRDLWLAMEHDAAPLVSAMHATVEGYLVDPESLA